MSEEQPTVAELYRLVQKIDHALNGNGQPGLVKTVERHDAWLKILGAGLAAVGGALAKTLIG